MIHAKNELLAQSTRVGVVNIQNIELQYFVLFFTTIGLQCAFIAGFQIRTISQVPIGKRTLLEDVVSLAFWISGAMSISLAFFGFLMCLYIRVFGQYLAIHGPPGSVLYAIKTFKEYQDLILITFSLNIIALAVSAAFEFYVFMKPISGAISSVIIVISGRYLWFHYCMRVYNGAKFGEETVESFDSVRCKAENELEPQYRTNSRYFSAERVAADSVSNEHVAPLSLRNDANDTFYSFFFTKKKHIPTFKEFVRDEEAAQITVRDSDTASEMQHRETLEIRDSVDSTTTGSGSRGHGIQMKKII